MPGRRFGDLERHLIDVHGEAVVTTGFKREYAGDLPYVNINRVCGPRSTGILDAQSTDDLLPAALARRTSSNRTRPR